MSTRVINDDIMVSCFKSNEGDFGFKISTRIPHIHGAIIHQLYMFDQDEEKRDIVFGSIPDDEVMSVSEDLLKSLKIKRDEELDL
jgi:hypothetical protein